MGRDEVVAQLEKDVGKVKFVCMSNGRASCTDLALNAGPGRNDGTWRFINSCNSHAGGDDSYYGVDVALGCVFIDDKGTYVVDQYGRENHPRDYTFLMSVTKAQIKLWENRKPVE